MFFHESTSNAASARLSAASNQNINISHFKNTKKMEENSNSDLKEDILAIDRIKISPKKVLIGLSEWLSSEWLSLGLIPLYPCSCPMDLYKEYKIFQIAMGMAKCLYRDNVSKIIY